MHITTSKPAADNHKQNDTPTTPRRLLHLRRPRFRGIRTRKSAVIEAALSPVKYAAFAALGHTTLHWVSRIDDPTTTVSVYARSGFFGGIVLVIPFLTRLLLASETEHEASESILRNQTTLIVKEAIYSAIAACIGCLALGVHRRYAASMMVVGAAGAFTSFVILYLALGIVLGLLWVILRCGAKISHS
ncbi:hypothetical protein M378DRAFT_314521 [Amanita muscaria Koide BX008]|uniref:Uncharacterized protein n=1 Tax=Amanita muscaria (strain Koide BX008) TaxID=946122 RepID=A0A0C2S725_AMAMK|nr:hypothetical protein M378DRAFT_314521 [Amanita muscaria Koide BX008]